MEKNFIQVIKDSVNAPYYRKYLSMIAEIDKYNFYVGHDISLKHVQQKLGIPYDVFRRIMNADKMDPRIYNKVAKFIKHSYESIIQREEMNRNNNSRNINNKSIYMKSRSK